MASFLDLFSLLLSLGRSTAAVAQDTLQRVQARPAPITAGRTTQVVFLEPVPAPSALAGQVKELLRQVGSDLEPRQLYDQLGAFSVDLNDAQADRLRGLPSIRSVEADRPVPLMPPVGVQSALEESGDDSSLQLAGRHLLWSGLFRNGFAANTAYSVEDQGLQLAAAYGDTTAASGETLPWGVKAVWNGADVSSRGNIGTGSTVFVIDSGVSDSTGDLNLNTAWSRSWIPGESPFTDGNGHGTHVAGTIAALANGQGVVGVAPGAEVVSLKVFDSTGAGASYTSIIDAINYAVALINTNGLDKSKVAINMSLSGSLSSSLTNAVYNAANQGIRFAIAAGNSGQDVDGFSPGNAGNHANVYTVSAVDSAYKMASWSNWDRVDSRDRVDNVDLAAPGVGVLSYYQGGQMAYLSGTSMAAPHVAGLLVAGGVAPGALVTPSVAGTADPFALAASTAPAPPPPPTYSLEVPSAVNEGTGLQITVATTNVAAGTVLNLQFSGTGISAADLASASLTAQVTIGSDGRGSFSTTVVADSRTEGAESLQVGLFSDSSLSTRLANATVALNDTSTTPVPPPGDTTAQVLWGTTGSDTITGGSGNDRISGVLASGTSAAALGTGQVDVLTGGGGSDVFVLGDSRGLFYDDRSSSTVGSGDYARITDFSSGTDKLQLRSTNYLVTMSAGTTSLYWDRNGDGFLGTSGRNSDELIAVIERSSITAADVIWV